MLQMSVPVNILSRKDGKIVETQAYPPSPSQPPLLQPDSVIIFTNDKASPLNPAKKP
jgi:hypothetical protein